MMLRARLALVFMTAAWVAVVYVGCETNQDFCTGLKSFFGMSDRSACR